MPVKKMPRQKPVKKMPRQNEPAVSPVAATPTEPARTFSAEQPVFVLAPPRSFSSVVCAMLGQHPQMYGLPETNLFFARTMGEWWTRCSRAELPLLAGLLRAVAQIYFGEQTEAAVKLASGWIKRRAHFTTGFLFEVIAEKLSPLAVVEKSPTIVRRIEFMQRAYGMFPQARFLHLIRHPRAQGESLLKFLSRNKAYSPVQRPDGLIGWVPKHEGSNGDKRFKDIEPQTIWHAQNVQICEFLESVSDAQKLRVRGEDLLRDPDAGLRRIVDWLGLRTDAEAIEMMKHPEQSLFACFGPPGARFGNDPFFLKNPALRAWRGERQSLDGPLTWRDDGQGFLPKVRRLAQQFGYE